MIGKNLPTRSSNSSKWRNSLRGNADGVFGKDKWPSDFRPLVWVECSPSLATHLGHRKSLGHYTEAGSKGENQDSGNTFGNNGPKRGENEKGASVGKATETP